MNIVLVGDPTEKIGYIYEDQMGNESDGSDKKQLSHIEGGITGFAYDPSMKRILYTVKIDPNTQDVYPQLPMPMQRLLID